MRLTLFPIIMERNGRERVLVESDRLLVGLNMYGFIVCFHHSMSSIHSLGLGLHGLLYESP